MATKNDLVSIVSKKIEYLAKEDVSNVIDLILDYLKCELAKQNRIEIRGLGTFCIRDRKKPDNDKLYKTIYYRMAKNILKEVNDIKK
jgi:nucleoid DNA-binding protein